MTSRSIHFACFNCISLNMCYDSFPCPNWLMGIHDNNFLTVKLLVTLMPAPCMSKEVPWCCPSYLHRLSLVIYMHFLSVISCLWEENVSDFFFVCSTYLHLFCSFGKEIHKMHERSLWGHNSCGCYDLNIIIPRSFFVFTICMKLY